MRSFFPSVCFFFAPLVPFSPLSFFLSPVSLALLLPPLLFGLFFLLKYFNRRKFALVEGVNHDLVCAGSNYHVHFAWQVWHGQYSPGFKFNKLKSFARVKIDRTHVDLKDSRGKGFALRRLNKHNFCPASVAVNMAQVPAKTGWAMWNRLRGTGGWPVLNECMHSGAWFRSTGLWVMGSTR